MKNPLIIPLSDVTESAPLAIDATVDEAVLRPAEVPGISLRSAHITGELSTVSATEEEYVFAGTVHGTFERPCDRCLDVTLHELELKVTWYFEPGTEALVDLLEGGDAFELTDRDIEGDEHRTRCFEGDAIDLASHVWEELVVCMPSKFLCKEECRGLCPRCGANLNDGSCTCAQEEESAGHGSFAALKEMFPNLRQNSSEE